jgi:hypothetical protein
LGDEATAAPCEVFGTHEHCLPVIKHAFCVCREFLKRTDDLPNARSFFRQRGAAWHIVPDNGE